MALASPFFFESLGPDVSREIKGGFLIIGIALFLCAELDLFVYEMGEWNWGVESGSASVPTETLPFCYWQPLTLRLFSCLALTVSVAAQAQ